MARVTTKATARGHTASFFREFSKVLSAEETQEEEEEERRKSSNENTNRKLLFGGASSGSSSSSNMGSTDGGNKKLVKAKTVAKTGETATANFLNWLANLDDDLKSTVVGVSLIDAPTAKDPKQRAAALTWLERTSQMYRDIIVDPIVEARGAVNKSGKNNKKQEKGEEASLPFLHVTMSPTMGIDVDEMAKWMRKLSRRTNDPRGRLWTCNTRSREASARASAARREGARLVAAIPWSRSLDLSATRVIVSRES